MRVLYIFVATNNVAKKISHVWFMNSGYESNGDELQDAFPFINQNARQR